MVKKDCVELYFNLNKLGNLAGVKFAYGVSKNLALLKPEIESLDKASMPTEEFKAFDEQRLEIVKKFAKKDEKGEPISENNAFIMEDQDAFELEFGTLKAEHQELWDARTRQLEEYNDLLNTESNVVLYKVQLSDVPSAITVAQMYTIQAMIEEGMPSPYAK